MKQILCFGDSNTWGLIPGTDRQYDWGVRWTSILQKKMNHEDICIIEEGLCGRTTMYEDTYRENRNGLKTLPGILNSCGMIESVVIMLGTNDCKSHYKSNAYKISKGLEQCLTKILEVVPKEKVLVVSPIFLGENVWKEEFDPEFDQNSVLVSKQLSNEYKKLADRKKTHFLDASDYAVPSEIDQEHMDEVGHAHLAQAIYDKLQVMINE